MLHVPSRWLKRSLIATTFLAAGALALGGAAEAQARHGCGYGGGYGGGPHCPGHHASYYHGHGGRGGYGYGPRPVVVAPPYGYGGYGAGYRGAGYGGAGYGGYYGGGSGVSISFGF